MPPEINPSSRPAKVLPGVADSRLLLGQDLRQELGVERCPVIRSARDVARAFGDLARLQRELMIAGAVDSQCRMLCWNVIAVGSGNLLYLRAGDAFHGAITCGAHGIFLVHNHPSGSLMVSEDDLALTRNLAQAGALLGYPLFDHVIVCAKGYTSVVQRYLLERSKLKPAQSRRTAIAAAADGAGRIMDWRGKLRIARKMDR